MRGVWAFNNPSIFVVALWPDTIFSGRKNAFWVKGILDLFIELHLRISIEVICIGDLVHNGKMSAILPPSVNSAVIDESADQPVRLAL